ncbi:DNA mismatch repair protein Msh3 [Brachionichthys hirsutus]|uniref:DNA mismatch repair protein Msh3 n=1 Tax=Brachionichthys hirsutus TaxID=412623 RepID=UPI0036051582
MPKSVRKTRATQTSISRYFRGRSSSSTPNTQRGVPNTQRGVPDTQRGVPDTQRGVPDTQRGAPDTQRGAPDTQRGVPDTQRGVPDTQRGVPNTQRGVPNTQRGVPDTQRGVPDTQRGVPNTQRGVPDTQRGVPNTQRGVPDTQRGVPNTQRGVPDTQRGVPDTQRGVPDTQRGVPNTQRGVPDTQRGVRPPSRVKHDVSSDDDDDDVDDDIVLPKKRAKLSPQNQQVEDLDCRPVSCLINKEITLSRGAGKLCSSTLEKLKGFASLAKSHVRHGGTDEATPPRDFTSNNNEGRVQQVEEGCEDEEEEVKGKKDSGRAPKTQGFGLSQVTKTGGEQGEGGEKVEGPNLLPDSSAPCRRIKSAYTPLERQVVGLKQQHKDALLAVECGYKYRFFGEDAEIAAKELNIICHLDHNFMTCSIPTHRLFVHVRRLVSHGHKVGVVKQTETSAIKASGTNRNALFTRQLTALYTKSTLVGEDVNPVCRTEAAEERARGDVVSDPSDCFLLCISENWDRLKKQLTVGLLAVQPSTGDVLVDCFPDGPSRSELEGRVLKINPVEILISSDLSEQTHRLLQSIACASTQADDRVRIEKRDGSQFEFPSAMNTVTKFYCQTEDDGSRPLSSVVSLESPAICCLGPLIQYLQEFNLERALKSHSSFQRLSCASAGMILGAPTLRNLEILNNQTDGGLKGSLLWVLDHTRTPFGRRLMRKWVSRPLTDAQPILERQDAVQEILESHSPTLNSIRSLLARLPDLDRGICSIYNKKSSTQEFYLITSSLCRLAVELQALFPAIESHVGSLLLRSLLLDTPDLLAPARSFLKVLNEKAAKSGNKTELFSDLSSFPVLQKRSEQIHAAVNDILSHRKEIRLTLKAPALDYTSVSGLEFLIEVRNSKSSTVPPDWVKISSTKTVSRFHSPFLVERYKKLQQLREQLLQDCQKEWTSFLDQFGEHYHTMKRAISHLATIDCLFSLAEVAKQGNYCRPEMCENQCQIVIRDGRHPAIDLLMGEHNQYVPNITELQGDGRRTMIITGPNMGGKSSYIRQVALICVMAQIGSYVPASEARLGMLDGVYTRMGASDNIYKGCSTFMEELTEASDIISHATERSLVILDELGRGTSTHDGIAIAYATLEYFIREVKALTLFVTHYPPLCDLERVYPEHVSNYHMAFLLNEPDIATDAEDGEAQPEFITFLYQLTEGAAGRSYGLNVARLADIPDSILHTAACKARELECTVNARRKSKKLLSDLCSISDRSTLMEWLQARS